MDNKPLYYFLVITTIIWVSVYLVITFFGNSIEDIPSNGNTLVPIVAEAIHWIISVLNTLTIGLISDYWAALSSQLDTFISVWNVIPIYLFYIIFIPYIIILVVIAAQLILPALIGGE